MILGLISDTHISQENEKLPPQIKDVFAGVDIILHGGDIYLLSVLDELQAIAPVIATRGNGDLGLPQDPRLKDSFVLNLEGLSLGLTHGIDYPEPSWRTLERAMDYEFGGKVDIIVFGDSHVSVLEVFKGTLLINPGSPTLPRQIKELGSVGLLQISFSRELKAQIIQLSTKLASHTLTYRP